ncbi:hypothetical protein BD289DRAFT_472544 [Coniella lustricola]|uniref:Uncharacterized protein n=1 Tax=Coniella lustricola TaxID=2025994 RepID=A0A2T3AF35_9PEZI|nr:hypothetical protein BD289DRAFT_472544 [Coniella lustricola]
MMPSFIGTTLPTIPPAQFSHDVFFEDVSKQMAMSASRRQSKASSGAARAANAMRVVKPSSASNSPRNNLLQQRRRTMMTDLAVQQQQQQMPQMLLQQPYLPTPGLDTYGQSCYEPVKRTARPMSWHPSTQLSQAYSMPSVSTQQSQYPFPSYCDYDFYSPPAQMASTPAAYSAYSSPISTFSPLALPAYSAYELPQTQAFTSPAWAMSAAPVAPCAMANVHTPPALDSTTSFAAATTPVYVDSSYSPASWTNVSSTGYTHHVSAPPTPEDMPSTQLSELGVVAKQTTAAYATPDLKADDLTEDDGDILVGLGLYDPPERPSLLGASFEPTGKGLKLEDAWEPPVTDDEEEDDEDEDDGEGEAERDDE